jgi:RNA polymerase sigma-70 factor (ECF subfamily)
MSSASPDVLLEKLCNGDDAAAKQAFLAYEPYLRMMVRRRLSPRVRPKFDSADVLQSVWLNLLQSFHKGRWHFDDAPHLRAFLIKVTRNLFLNRLRLHKNALQREETLAGSDEDWLPPSPQPRPSEVAQAGELWDRLLALCPLAHRELLTLKKQGLSLGEIAERTGLHPSSVRRILYDLARRCAFQK